MDRLRHMLAGRSAYIYRTFVIASLLLAIPGPLLCRNRHYCRCGHMQHGVYPLREYAIDCGAPVFLGIASFASLRSGYGFRNGLVIAGLIGVAFASWPEMGLLRLLAIGPMLLMVLYGMRETASAQQAASCVHCGFDLTGNVPGICPECGTPTESCGTKS